MLRASARRPRSAPVPKRSKLIWARAASATSKFSRSAPTRRSPAQRSTSAGRRSDLTSSTATATPALRLKTSSPTLSRPNSGGPGASSAFRRNTTRHALREDGVSLRAPESRLVFAHRPVLPINFGEARVLVAEPLDRLVVQLDAQAGFLRQLNVALHHALNRLRHQRRAVRVPMDHFLDEEIRNRRVEVEASRRRHRAQRVMRRKADVVGLRHGGDLLQLRYPAGVHDIRLDDVGDAFFQDFAEAPHGKKALARR